VRNGPTRAPDERSLSMEREPIMAQKKKVVSEESPFLKSAAEAIGTTIGKLALRTGVVKPPAKTAAKPKKAAPKKRTLPAKRGAVASPAKKAARKTSR